ncbi:MAG: response regulator [Deltaproteobacteria bacterium]|nr:response regulator [Deltaproteobacteria bacterium]
MLRTIKRALGDHDLITCTSGEAALKLPGLPGFDTILVDVQMPEMDGISFFHNLVQRVPGVEERVIFMTGGAPNQQAKLRLERTGKPCLMKPFTLRQLRRAVNVTLAGSN